MLCKILMSIALVRAKDRCIRGSRIPVSNLSNRFGWEGGAGLGILKSDAESVKSKTDNQFSLGQAITMSAEKWLHQPTIKILCNNEWAELIIKKYNNTHVKVADQDFSGVYVRPYSTLESKKSVIVHIYSISLERRERAY